MNNNNSVAIHFNGLDAKELALFERVISFSSSHGLVASSVDDIASADLVILSSEVLASVAAQLANKTSIIISNDITNDETALSGDIQITRPLMITKVMGALNDAIKLLETQATASTDDSDISTPEMQNEASTKEQTKDTAHHALVIDDSAAIRKQLELELRDAGITTEFAESGEQALEITENKEFDLVFLDIIMPGLDGYETCQAMRKNPAYKRTPIIMLSGKTSPLDEVQGVIAGATTYLTKPVKSGKLQETLNRVTKWINNYAPAKSTENV